MSFVQSDLVLAKRIPGKGLGIVARKFIKKGTEIERVPVLVMRTDEIVDTKLGDYCFTWGKNTVALALGYGSLYNHSYKPNACYEDVAPRTKVFLALRDIKPGEEITINYNADPRDRSHVGFDVL